MSKKKRSRVLKDLDEVRVELRKLDLDNAYWKAFRREGRGKEVGR
jgi:hypothetical protein